MTSVVRYVNKAFDNTDANTRDATVGVDSVGKDYSYVQVERAIPVALAHNANHIVFRWTGAGTIKAIGPVKIVTDVGATVPVLTADLATANAITIVENGKAIQFAIGNNAAIAVPANAVVQFLLTIGDY